jgi:hypothetical protein
MTRRGLGSVADGAPGSTLRTAAARPPVTGRVEPWPPPVPGHPAQTGPSSLARFLEMIFLVGLGGVFLANAAVAWVEPAGFTKLVHDSGIGRWLRLDHADGLIPLIGINDLVVGAAVLGAIWSRPTPRRVVLAWAGLWLLAVTLLKLTAL